MSCHAVVIGAVVNNQYVSVENNYGGNGAGMLRARSTAVGPWEQLTQCQDPSTGYVSFQAPVNGTPKWVSAEILYPDYPGMLRARADTIGQWEQFRLVPQPPNGVVAIQSVANGQYVSAEFAYGYGNYAMLRARAATVGSWEQFSISPLASRQDLATGFCLDSNSAGQAYTLGCNGGDYQKWIISTSPTCTGPCSGSTFQDLFTGSCLDSNTSGQVYTLPCNGGSFQKWVSNGWTLQDLATGFCLDSNTSGQLYTLPCNGGSFQKWS